ncbi:MAG: TSUP family transporter [FCB group bacterium]|nr:TSUP family transporter [FCB group bacterium]
MTIFYQVLAIGLVAGVAGGMFGLGGGAIMVPALVLLLAFEQKSAQGMSIVAQILPIGLLGAIAYYRSGNLTASGVKWGLVLALGLLIGNLAGAMLANQSFITNDMMKKLYGVFLLLIAARYLLWK